MKDSFTLDQVRRISLVIVIVGLIIGISGAVRILSAKSEAKY